MNNGIAQGPAATVAYLINQYPKVSHTFIRREILALERQGIKVQRIAIRGWDAHVADPVDAAECARTQFILANGAVRLLLAALAFFVTSPRIFLKGLALAWRMSRRADRSLPYHLMYLAEAVQVVAWTRTAGATHLHAHFGTNSAEVAMLSRELGGPPYSFTAHGPEEFDKPEFIGLKEKIERSAFVVGISSFGRSQLFRWIDYAQWPKVQVVHCGLDPAFHAGFDGAPAQNATFVCVGRLCEQKGQMLLIQAANQLIQSGINLQIVLAGDGEMRGDIEALIARCGIGAQVRITGWIGSDQVRSELIAARAMVLPSFAEGLPVVIMEAMSLHRPVITTYVAGIPELVRPGDTGWLVSPGDVDALADALRACLALPASELAAMGKRAHTTVLQRHDVDTEAAKLVRLFAASAATP